MTPETFHPKFKIEALDERDRRFHHLAARTRARPGQPPGQGHPREQVRPARRRGFRQVAPGRQPAARCQASRGEEGRPAPAADVQVDQAIKRRFLADPEVVALATEMLAAKNKLDDVRRIVGSPGDPALQAAQKKQEALQARLQMALGDQVAGIPRGRVPPGSIRAETRSRSWRSAAPARPPRSRRPRPGATWPRPS